MRTKCCLVLLLSVSEVGGVAVVSLFEGITFEASVSLFGVLCGHRDFVDHTLCQTPARQGAFITILTVAA